MLIKEELRMLLFFPRLRKLGLYSKITLEHTRTHTKERDLEVEVAKDQGGYYRMLVKRFASSQTAR